MSRDTTIIVDPHLLSKEMHRVADSLGVPDSLIKEMINRVNPENYTTSNDSFNWVVFVFLLALAGRIAFPYVMEYIRSRLRLKRIIQEFEQRFEEYDKLLSTHNYYYSRLDRPSKRRFVRRVLRFKHKKKFNFIEIEPDDMKMILVSAAAIQVSFGLNQYLLKYFDTIYVLRQDYNYGSYPMPFQGHVNIAGIYLSWSHFLYGYQNYSDAHNVGLHEMAHALAFVNFSSEEKEDPEFSSRFKEFSKVARPVFNSMQQGKSYFLDTYAGTNYHEFWAVCVETFFERSLQFKAQMPELYEALCKLLNQDPSKEQVILDPVKDM